jgi:DNA-directed RNA polymerase specialized sigma24 family protein
LNNGQRVAYDAADDAMQETLVAVFRHIGSLRDPAALKGWVRRIAVREADSYRALTEIHVLDQWRYLGSARTESELAALLEQCKLPAFDLEHYRLLSRYLTKAQRPLPVIEVGRPEAPAMVW